MRSFSGMKCCARPFPVTTASPCRSFPIVVDAPIDVSFEDGAGLTERDLKAARRPAHRPAVRSRCGTAVAESMSSAWRRTSRCCCWSCITSFRTAGRCGCCSMSWRSAYRAYCHDESPRWPALPVQYADYALWQREWLSGAKLDRQIDYWRAQLAGAPPLLQLPVDRPRPAVQTHRGAWMRTRLSRRLSAELHELGRDGRLHVVHGVAGGVRHRARPLLRVSRMSWSARRSPGGGARNWRA